MFIPVRKKKLFGELPKTLNSKISLSIFELNTIFENEIVFYNYEINSERKNLINL